MNPRHILLVLLLVVPCLAGAQARTDMFAQGIRGIAALPNPVMWLKFSDANGTQNPVDSSVSNWTMVASGTGNGFVTNGVYWVKPNGGTADGGWAIYAPTNVTWMTTNSFTLSFWWYSITAPTLYPTPQIRRGPIADGVVGFSGYVSRFYLFGAEMSAAQRITLPQTNWVHAAMSWNKTTQDFTTTSNGVVLATVNTNRAGAAYSARWRIGPTDTAGVQCYMDDVRLYNVGLVPEQLNSMYLQGRQ